LNLRNLAYEIHNLFIQSLWILCCFIIPNWLSTARQARVGQQELEAGVNRVVKLLGHQTKTHKQKLMQQHKVLKEVLTMQKSAKVTSGLSDLVLV
jgi:hypothetical protein